MSRYVGPILLSVVVVLLLVGSAAGVAYLGGLLWERFESEAVCCLYGVSVFVAGFVTCIGGAAFFNQFMAAPGMRDREDR